MRTSCALLLYILLVALPRLRAFWDTYVNECKTDKDCSSMLSGVTYEHCMDLFNANTAEDKIDNFSITCSLDCRSYLQKLEVKSADFNKLMTTDCGENTDCPTYKHRIRRCLRGDIREFSTSNLLKSGCTRAYQRCQRNKQCKKMHDDMTNIHCSLLIPGIECTQECETALMALTRTRKTKKYLRCRCDSSFHYEGVCHNIRNNALTLCKSKEFRSFLKRKNIYRDNYN